MIPGFHVARIESRPRRQYALRTEPSFRATAVTLVLPPYPSPPSTVDTPSTFHQDPHLGSPIGTLPPPSPEFPLLYPNITEVSQPPEMDYIRHTYSRPIRASQPKIASPVPVKHWSNFETILEWQERTSDALDDEFYDDEPVSANSSRKNNAKIPTNNRTAGCPGSALRPQRCSPRKRPTPQLGRLPQGG